LENAGEKGVKLRCADGYKRNCFPILAKILSDHEEQCLLTGVKHNQHCTVCLVPPVERTNLLKRHESRSHYLTQLQHEKQQKEDMDSRDPSWVHPIDNFAWKLPYANVHDAVAVDILHQLFKGIMKYTREWTKTLVKNVHPWENKSELTRKGPEKRIDERLRQLPYYSGVKHFNQFSEVKQWTAVEEKGMLQQMLIGFAPFLDKNHSNARFIKAVCDFIMLSRYLSHDDKSLGNMEKYLKIMNKEKDSFSKFRETANGEEKKDFNFPKWHAMTHYVPHIRAFGACIGYNTEQTEAAHKFLLKAYYPRTNKINWEYQLRSHNVRRLNMVAFQDKLALWGLYWPGTHDQCFTPHDKEEGNVEVTNPLHVKDAPTNRTVSSKSNTTVQQTSPMTPVPMANSKTIIPPPSRAYMRSPQMGINHHPIKGIHSHLPKRIDGKNDLWPEIGEVERLLQLDGLQLAFLDYIKRSRPLLLKHIISEDDLESVNINVCTTLTCWKRDANSWEEDDPLVKDLIHWSRSWRNTLKGREDWVWVQEHSTADGRNDHNDPNLPQLTRYLRGRIPGKVLLLFNARFDTGAGKNAIEQCAYIHTLTPVHDGIPHDHHGLIEFRDPSFKRTTSGQDSCSGTPAPYQTPQTLRPKKISFQPSKELSNKAHLRDFNRCPTKPTVYNIDSITRSAYIATTKELLQHNGHYYANPYIDWDTYNILY
jgi:Plavaka transposase